jgi:hypothetical protein
MATLYAPPRSEVAFLVQAAAVDAGEFRRSDALIDVLTRLRQHDDLARP